MCLSIMVVDIGAFKQRCHYSILYHSKETLHNCVDIIIITTSNSLSTIQLLYLLVTTNYYLLLPKTNYAYVTLCLCNLIGYNTVLVNIYNSIFMMCVSNTCHVPFLELSTICYY